MRICECEEGVQLRRGERAELGGDAGVGGSGGEEVGGEQEECGFGDEERAARDGGCGDGAEARVGDGGDLKEGVGGGHVGWVCWRELAV